MLANTAQAVTATIGVLGFVLAVASLTLQMRDRWRPPVVSLSHAFDDMNNFDDFVVRVINRRATTLVVDGVLIEVMKARDGEEWIGQSRRGQRSDRDFKRALDVDGGELTRIPPHDECQIILRGRLGSEPYVRAVVRDAAGRRYASLWRAQQ